MKNRNLALSLLTIFLLSLFQPLSLNPLAENGETALLASGRSSACTGTVCINEVIPNPNGADDATYPNGEWFELTNSGTSDVDLTGWKATTSAGKTLAFDGATIIGYQAGNTSTWTISPGEYVVIARNGDNNFYLTNTGLTLNLIDANNNQVHSATWGSTSSGVSYEQDPANATAGWVPTGSPSPGQANSAGGPATLIPGDLIITEVMANPWPSYDNATWPGGEWVEVLNTGPADIDLTGYSVVDAAGNVLPFNSSHLVNATVSSSSYLIGPGEHRILAVNGTSPYGVLNNGAESLTLKWPNGSPSQEVSWTTTLQGFSLTTSLQANGLWSHAPYPTPEGMNPPGLELMPRQAFDIEFSELLSNATNDGATFPDGEWIELHNTGNVSVDLMGWSILDGMGNITHLDPGTLVFNSSQGASVIEAGERRLVQFTSYTQLWDDYNHLFLRDASNQIVDTAYYTTDYGEDVALIRAQQPTDAWTPAPWKTPGQPEPGSVPSASTLRFSEVLPDAKGADNQAWPNGEWVELHNYGTTDIDLSGWKLQAASRSLTLHEFNMPLQSTPVINAGDVALIALNGTSSFYLKHTAPDSIGLVDASGSMVDTIAWSTTVEGESLVPPNSTHAGVGPNASMATGDWLLSAWATPGEANPVWPEYNGSIQLKMTEILPYCNDDSIEPTEDWVEIHNTGTTPLNISRWSIQNADGDRRFVRPDKIWELANGSNPLELAPDERAVVLLEAWMLTGLGDYVVLLHPDGGIVDEALWTVITDCQTLMLDEASTEWKHTLWPTPGQPEPDPSSFAGAEDIVFTRFMPTATSDFSGDMEFIEVSNLGDQMAVLNGWVLRSTTGTLSSYNATFTSLTVEAGASVMLANDADALAVFESGTIADLDSVLDRPFYFPDSGTALQLIDPSGAEADTLVYGNGPVSLSGWSGIALVEPLSNLDNLIYLRGSGCGDAPDTNTVADWHHRWSRLGGSTFCYGDIVTGTGTVTPLIAPENGLVDLLAWINGATSSLSVHLYQLQEAHLVQALIDANNRGVDVRVVLDYGDSWWNQYDMDAQKGMATHLKQAGVAVYWFGDTGENPYAYIHSKVAVRDNSSVWMGSGNWKSSSQPAPGESGNRDWGVLIEDPAFAQTVKQHLAFDEDASRPHVTPVLLSDAPAGWSFPATGPVVGNVAQGIVGDYEAALLVCPDNCIASLVDMLNGAEQEILLSLQYLDLDWSYGWGENPIVQALEDAAQRGVRIRLALNGAYLDEDIQEAVDRFNEDWNFTQGYDTAAIVMSSDANGVTKLHNKGAIIDGEQVLISSINWGASALVRNREMGVLITSEEIAAVYMDAWQADWERVDDFTDSDQDGLLDAWEVQHGLKRTQRSVAATGVADEAGLDPDADGLTHEAEQLHGGDPNLNDTDGDCILDGVEVAWALSTALDESVEDVSPTDALTLADADGDGVNESDALGCDLGGMLIEPEGNNSSDDLDEDNDGVLDDNDICPDTEVGVATDDRGCSSAQRAGQVQDGTKNTGGDAAQSFFMVVMILALVLSAGAYIVLRNMRNDGQTVKQAVADEVFADVPRGAAEPQWPVPVLNASEPAVTQAMLDRVPGWNEEMVKTYLLQGWTMDQLATYYEEQVAEHASLEQH